MEKDWGLEAARILMQHRANERYIPIDVRHVLESVVRATHPEVLSVLAER
jgi:hypothetical protein